MTRRPEREQKSRRWRLRAFRDAARGLKVLVATQPNARFHLVATAGAIIAAAAFRIAASEWTTLLLAIGGVWVAEALNTAVEFAIDLISPEHHPVAGWAKDVAAGGVLVASVVAALVGAILFLPRIAAAAGFS